MAKVTQPTRGPGTLPRACCTHLPVFSSLAETGSLSQVPPSQVPRRPRGLSLPGGNVGMSL